MFSLAILIFCYVVYCDHCTVGKSELIYINSFIGCVLINRYGYGVPLPPIKSAYDHAIISKAIIISFGT